MNRWAAFFFAALLFGWNSSAASLIQGKVEASGRYSVQVSVEGRSEGWLFEGSVPAPQGVSIRDSQGDDPIGHYEEFSFSPNGAQSDQLRYSIRVYEDPGVVLFSQLSEGQPANGLRFPVFDHYPDQNIRHLSHKRMEFAPTVSGLSGDAPWLFFAPSGSSFVLSPADHFMISNCFKDAQGKISVGIEPQVVGAPPSFQRTSVLAFGRGPSEAYENWGKALTRLSGKALPANDADAVLNTLGYWTDNRSSYWYNYDLALGYTATIEAMQKESLSRGIHFGHLQLDSWWYLKGGDPLAKPPLPVSWKQANYNHGIYLYEPAPELFPTGLSSFQRAVGLPLVTHARWIDPSSPYAKKYRLSNQVSVDPAYWDMIMGNLEAEGVLIYEQDWMNSKALPRLDQISDGDEFLDQMSEAAVRHGLGLQYCMPLARHFMQASRYSNVRTIRTSGDGFERSKWNQFLYGSRVASAVGVWPWADVFFSADRSNILIATLSGGIVGVGDRLTVDADPKGDLRPDYCGHSLNCRPLDVENLNRAARADGVVVKPDVALVPTDRSYLGLSGFADNSSPMVAVAYTDSAPGTHLAAYVFAYSQKKGVSASIGLSPRELGFGGDVYVYDDFAKSGRRVSAQDVYSVAPDYGGSYLIVVPMDSRGMAWLGDLNLFASMGRKRIEFSGTSGASRVFIHFGAGETEVPVSLYTGALQTQKILTAIEGAVDGGAFEAATGVTTWKVQRPVGDVRAAADAVLEFVQGP